MSGIYDTHVRLQEGLDYTVAGNVITFVERTPSESFEPWNYVDRRIFVDTTVTVTTIDPLAGPGDALIQAMNPAHILYEAFTNREWGRGLPRNRLGTQSWQYAAEKLFSERFGLCIRWTRTDVIESFIQTILDHIGATIYENRTTGRTELMLIRGDYIKANLPFFDKDSGLLKITEASSATLGRSINEVRVTYRDPVTNEDRTVRASNLAALQAARGEINSVTKSYPGIPTADLALKIAQRDMKAMGPGIRRFTVQLDRRANGIYPGGVIRVQDLPRNLPDMVLRVITVDYGRIGQGEITAQCAQDVFGLPERNFTIMEPPTWTPPKGKPCIGDFKVFEVPYRSLYRTLAPADFALVDPTAAYLGTVVQEGQPTNQSYTIAVRDGSPEDEDQPPDDSYVCGV